MFYQLFIRIICTLIVALIAFDAKLGALPTKEVYLQRSLQKPNKKIIDLFSSIYIQEKKYSKNYFQFLTGMSSEFIAYQVILKKLYELKYKKEFKDFEFLRPYSDPELKKELWDLFAAHSDLINQEFVSSLPYGHPLLDQGYGSEDDLIPSVSKQLISVSLTLESKAEDISANYFFFANESFSDVSSVMFKWLQNAFLLEGIQSRKANDCLKFLLKKAPRSSKGIIIQILIPKEDVLSCLYVSKACGFVDIEHTQNMIDYIERVQMKRDSSLFDPEEDIQFRILAGSLNPDRIKIFRYSLFTNQEIQKYETLVQKHLKELL